MKRVNGLERRLKDEAKPDADQSGESSDQILQSREDDLAQHEQSVQPESSRSELRQPRPSIERPASSAPSFQYALNRPFALLVIC